jgi:dolichol-phosphate mannosyltransferase
VVVDDGSTDTTPDIVKAHKAMYLRHDQRLGVGASIRDGIRHLQKNNYDVVVVMAGNGKDDPQEIPLVSSPVTSGTADYVQGSRFLRGGSFKNLPTGRYFMIKSFTTLWSLAVGKKLTDVTNGFRAYRLDVLGDPSISLDQPWLDTYSLEYYLHYKFLMKYRFLEVPVSKNYPATTKYSKIRPLLDWWSIIKPLFLLRFGIKS